MIGAAKLHLGVQNIQERLDIELKIHPVALRLGDV